MRKIKQSTAKHVMVLMVDGTDHVTGKTGLTLTINASKDGGAFAAITPTVTERGAGWYDLALTSGNTDTLGDLALHITGAAADPADLVLLVEAGATDADVSSRMATFSYTTPPTVAAIRTEMDANSTKLANLDATISSRSTFAGGAVASVTGNVGGSVASVTAAVTVGGFSAGALTATAIATGALNGKGDWNIGKTGYTLTQAFPTNFSSMAITAGGAVTAGTVSDKTGYSVSAISAGVINATVAPNLDAAVSSRSTFAGGAVASVTAAVTVGAMNADTITAATIAAGAITSSEAPALANLDAAVSTRLASAGYTAPDNSSIATILSGVNAIYSVVDTEVAAILAKTSNLPADTAATLTALSNLTTEIRKLLRNKRIVDPATGIETIYDDGGTVLFTRNVYQDAAGTIPYAGAGADRVERYS